MIDRQNRRRQRRLFDEKVQRHLGARNRRRYVEMRKRPGRGLRLRLQFEDDMVAIEIRKILGNLALAEGIVERVVDELR